MRAVVQRVLEASVSIDHGIRSQIRNGLLVLVGIEDTDTAGDVEWLSKKIVNLRIFDDENKVPNVSVKDTGGDILAISQFTLYAAIKRGNRPSYTRASKASVAIPLYEKFIIQLAADMGKTIYTGEFGADMKVAIINDGPVTVWIDTANRE